MGGCASSQAVKDGPERQFQSQNAMQQPVSAAVKLQAQHGKKARQHDLREDISAQQLKHLPGQPEHMWPLPASKASCHP